MKSRELEELRKKLSEYEQEVVELRKKNHELKTACIVLSEKLSWYKNIFTHWEGLAFDVQNLRVDGEQIPAPNTLEILGI